MTKSSPHYLLFSLLSADGRFHAPSPSPKIWCLLKKKYRGLKMKYRTLKLLRRRKNARRSRTTEKGVQALIIGLALVLFLLVGCENGARHSLELTEPTDHTSGDDGGKLKYKIIWGSTKHNE
jgi:hypothetical protein